MREKTKGKPRHNGKTTHRASTPLALISKHDQSPLPAHRTEKKRDHAPQGVEYEEFYFKKWARRDWGGG